MSPSPVRVYVSGPAFHLRPGNTDWQYLNLLTQLPEFASELTIYREHHSWRSVAFNLRYAASVPLLRMGLPLGRALQPGVETSLPAADLRRAQCEVVYAYGAAPVNAGRVPVVFHTGAIDRARVPPDESSQRWVSGLETRIRRLASQAVLLTANSQAALDNLAQIMPEIRPRMRVLPFFLPHLRAVDQNSIAVKFRDPTPLRLLFVGREARRKGLPEVLAAFVALDALMPGQLHLTIVSSRSDGEVLLPPMPNLTLTPQLDREAVQSLMRSSHMLLMPSHFEGYGWVYLEAMAAGVIPVASSAPIQREILADGSAGILTTPNAVQLEAALTPVLRSRGLMEALALRAWKRCATHYLPGVVASRMSEVFTEAKELGRGIS